MPTLDRKIKKDLYLFGRNFYESDYAAVIGYINDYVIFPYFSYIELIPNIIIALRVSILEHFHILSVYNTGGIEVDIGCLKTKLSRNPYFNNV